MGQAVAQSEQEQIHTKIWHEQSEDDNPFAAKRCLCAGYDVYADILPNASWSEYLYLLFKLQQPQNWQALLLEKIAIAIANPGIRHHSVRAAMSAAVGSSTSASSLMAALAVGAGKLDGAREIYNMLECWQDCQLDLTKWAQYIQQPSTLTRSDVWGEMEHFPGFDPNGVACALPVKQVMAELTKYTQGSNLIWLAEHQHQLEALTGLPLAMSGVIAAAFKDLAMSPEQAEMLYLLLRLPGAAVHALEQREHGWKKYPFFADAVTVTNDPDTQA